MEPDISSLAALIGEPARGRMLLALLDGRGLPASELARRAGITCQTASSHLARLVEGNLLRVIPQGRHRYYRITNARVAELLELMANMVPRPETDFSQARPQNAIHLARTCYNHLAGRLGVGITRAIVDRGYLLETDRDYKLSSKGAAWFKELGIDAETLKKSGRVFARQCIDWSERRNHLAGALGSGLAGRLFDLTWIKRAADSRAVRVTELGRQELKGRLGLKWPPPVP
jgi:DNA-binding transcriptional ArsR family regulator